MYHNQQSARVLLSSGSFQPPHHQFRWRLPQAQTWLRHCHLLLQGFPASPHHINVLCRGPCLRQRQPQAWHNHLRLLRPGSFMSSAPTAPAAPTPPVPGRPGQLFQVTNPVRARPTWSFSAARAPNSSCAKPSWPSGSACASSANRLHQQRWARPADLAASCLLRLQRRPQQLHPCPARDAKPTVQFDVSACSTGSTNSTRARPTWPSSATCIKPTCNLDVFCACSAFSTNSTRARLSWPSCASSANSAYARGFGPAAPLAPAAPGTPSRPGGFMSSAPAAPAAPAPPVPGRPGPPARLILVSEAYKS